MPDSVTRNQIQDNLPKARIRRFMNKLLHLGQEQYIIKFNHLYRFVPTKGDYQNHMRQQQKLANIFIDTLLIVIVVLLLGIGVVYFSLSLTIAATLLIGVWVIDAFLKRTYNFDSDTIFADLTLASFAYSTSYAVSLLLLDTEKLSPISIVHAFIITFLIFLTWLANISLCRIFQLRADNRWIKPLSWFLSAFIAIASVFLAFYPFFI